jgi:hypothetical protein
MTDREDLRRALEEDCEPEAASLFTALAAEYLAASRDRSAVVSAVQDQRMLADRFDEPLPRRPAPLAAVVDRIRRDVIPDSNWLYHPRAMGHQVAPPCAPIHGKPASARIPRCSSAASMRTTRRPARPESSAWESGTSSP